jgi:hypothetical protein
VLVFFLKKSLVRVREKRAFEFSFSTMVARKKVLAAAAT